MFQVIVQISGNPWRLVLTEPRNIPQINQQTWQQALHSNFTPNIYTPQDIFKQIAGLINKSGFIRTDPDTWTIQCDVNTEFDAGAYAAVTIISLFGLLVVVGTTWHLLEPIIKSFTERKKEDLSVLVEAEETPNKDQDKETRVSEATASTAANLSPLGQFFKCFALQETMKSLFSTTTKPGVARDLNNYLEHN